jgi:hypothetical protein
MKSTLSLRSAIQDKTRSLLPPQRGCRAGGPSLLPLLTRAKKTRSLLLPVLTRRLFLLTLVSLVAVAALLSIAASANKANRAAKARDAQAAASKSAIIKNSIAPQPLAPLAPAITATLTDNIPAATKVAPGGTINYTAVITNTGVSPTDDATNLNFSDTLDSNTTLTAGSIHASPLAFNDTYNWVGNTFLDTSARALPPVTTNDVAVNPPGGTDTFTLTTIAGGATSLGGSVTLAANGSFTYTPPLGRPNIADGASATDTFTYTIVNSSDATLVGTGTVTINLTGRVWYLQAGAAGDGRSNTPSGSPSAMSTAADKTTDIFYIFSNASSLNGLFSLDNSQQLLGQGVNLVVNAITLFTAAAPTPTTTDTTGNGVTLGNGNTLSGFDIGNCSGTAILGTNVGTLTINNLSINTTGVGLDLTGVTTPTVSIVLGGLTSTGGTKNVNLVGLNGTITLAGGTLSGASGNAFDVTGAGTANITYSGTISNTAGARLINISGKTGGTVAFSGAVSGTGSSTGINLATNTGATINFTGGINLNAANAGFAATGGGTVSATQNNSTIVNTITTTTGTALNVANTTIGGSGLTFRSISSNGAANGILLNATGAGGLTVTGNGGSCSTAVSCTGGAIQNSTQDAVKLTSANSISLTDMFLFSSAQSNVDATTVTGLTLVRIFSDLTTDDGILGSGLTNLTITNGTYDRGGAGSVACNVNGVEITNLLGTSSVTGATFKRSNTIQFHVNNNTATNFAGTADQLTVTGTNWNTHTNPCAGDHLSVNSDTGGNFKLIVNSASGINTVVGAGIGVQATSGGTNGKMESSVTGLNTSGNTAGVVIGNTGTGSTNKFNIFSNKTANGTGFSGTGSLAIAVTHVSSGGTTSGFIDDNSVTHTAGPGTNAVQLVLEGGGTLTSTVSNNTISGNYQRGIQAQSRLGTGLMSLTINNNTLTGTDTTGVALQQVNIETGGSGTGHGNAICLNMFNNSVNLGAGATYTAAYRLTNRGVANCTLQACSFALQNFVGNGSSTADVMTWVTTTKSNTGTPVSVTATQAYITSAGCATPPPIANPADDNVRTRMDVLDSNARAASAETLPVVADQQLAPVAKVPVPATHLKPVALTASKALLSRDAVRSSETNKGDKRLSHHAARSNTYVAPHAPNAPLAGETVSLNTITTFPAGKSITIKYSATVNTPPTTRQVSTQGTISGGNFASFLTDDPDLGGASDPTVTLIDTLSTWTGATSTDWNVATNWTPNTYVPGTLNPGVNDVVIPNVGAQPNINTVDVNIFSLSLANGRTLTINGGLILMISGGAAGSDLTLDGIISGGALNFAGAGPHVINNAGGTGSLTSTNVTTLLIPASVTLNNDLQMGALAVNSGATMNITSRTLSLNGSGAALTIGGALTTTGSTVVLNGSAAQTIAGITYNNLTINNSIGAHVTGVTLTGNATVNGALTLTSSDLDTGAFTLTMPAAATSGPASGASDVVGNVKRTGFVINGAALSFGNPFNTIKINTGTGAAPTDINILIAKNAPTTYTTAVQRSYTITANGGSSINATVRLHYRQGELNGNSETPTADFNFRRLTAGLWKAVVPTSRNVGVVEDNWLENNAVTTFSEWTFANLAPTASGGVVTGRIVDNNGMPVEGAVVRLQGTQNRKFITDANGFYRFENVETNGFYIATPSRANYTFSPSSRSFSQIGETTEATFGASLTGGGFVNPLDTPEYFVRQHYLDFLGREPDEAGFNFWSDQILECGNDNACSERRRENVSAAYFLSIEFQQTGGLVDGLYRASYGRQSQFSEFMPDTRAVGLGVRVGEDGWEAKLRANKQAFVAAFVNRATFVAVYGNMDNSLFVDTLIGHTGVSFTAGERDALANGLATGTMTRADVLRSIAENNRFVNAKFNEAFVMMEYFGYLRRDPDASGYAFWLNKLSEFNGNFERAEMVKAFIVSGEFRDRFPR